MIIYKDVLKKLKEAGYPTTRLRNEKLLSEATIGSIRHNVPVNTETINTICKLTGLPVEEVMEYIPDKDEEK